jgi:hypothetical protein
MLIRHAISLVLFLSSIAVAGEDPCVDPLKEISTKIDTADIGLIISFLDTFLNSTCQNNVEHSEWGNELVFVLMQNRPVKFFRTLFQLTDENREAIITEINNPLLDANCAPLWTRYMNVTLPNRKRVKIRVQRARLWTTPQG